MADCPAYAGPLALEALSNAGEGRVIGLFHQGWYLDCGGRVLMVHDDVWGAVPFGLGVPDLAGHFPYVQERAEMPVFWDGETLTIPAAGQTLVLHPAPQETLLPAEGVCGPAACLAMRAGRGCLYRLIPHRQRLLAGEDPEELFPAGSPEGTFARQLRALFQALDWQDIPALSRALCDLLGWGPGLTPAGDDFLAGFLYALGRLPGSGEQRTALCSPVIALAGQHTGRISAAYLTAAAAGERFSLLDRAMHSPDGCVQLLRVGHSSGSDMLTGLLFGWAYADSQRTLDI